MILLEAYNANMIIQYSIVGIVLLVACGWIIWKIFRKQKKNNSPCCGCSLSESCDKKKIKEKYHGKNTDLQ